MEKGLKEKIKNNVERMTEERGKRGRRKQEIF
jgi:hypothetical protein